MNKLKSLLWASASFVSIVAMGQNSISQRQCWLDGQVDKPQALTDAIDISQLSVGLHSLTVRVKDNQGLWSSPVTKYFVIAPTDRPGNAIAAREYWIDGDIAQRKSLAASAAQINLSALTVGLHSIALRVCDDRGVWSSPITKYFVIAPTDGPGTDIAAREYWIDGDIAQRQPLAADAAQIDLSALTVGLHSLAVRVCDDRGVWSSPITKYFVIAPTDGPGTTITAREYWIDDRTNSQPLDASVATIDLSDLSPGLHFLTVRVKDDNGVWSAPVTQHFVVTHPEEGQDITHYVYWFDDDNAHAQSGKLEAASGIIAVSIKDLAEGRHALSWAVGNSRGQWSAVATDSFVVEHVPMAVGMISLATNTFEYQGTDITPDVTVKDGDETLVQDEDYEVVIADNLNAGQATMTIRGLGFYKDSIITTFTIEPAVLTVRANDQAKEQGQENPELTFTIEGWKGSDDESLLTEQPVATTQATAESPVGTYEIFVDGGKALNYTFTYVAGTLTVNVPSAIDGIIADGEDGQWYNINGQKMGQRPKKAGIYIVNGKKVAVR